MMNGLTVCICLAVALSALSARAEDRPLPPCLARGVAVSPAYAEPGAAPTVQTWHDLALESDGPCLGSLHGEMELVVALAGRFSHTGSLEDIASRIGEIAATEGLRYWSTTDGRWRPLISDAFALDGPDEDTSRGDFTAEEVLGGETLYFAQDDTRSSGLNLYGLTTRVATPERVVIEVVNLSRIRFLFATLFDPGDLVSVHFIEHLGKDVWGYYGLSGVRDGAGEGHEKSFVNRAAAFYRFLIGVPADREPPLAP